MLNTWLEISGYEIMGCSDVSTSKEQNGKNRGMDFLATEEKVTGELLVLWRTADYFNLHSNIL